MKAFKMFRCLKLQTFQDGSRDDEHWKKKVLIGNYDYVSNSGAAARRLAD